MSEFLLTVDQPIKASRSKVWDALTNPAMIKKYMFGTDTESTWKVGGPITFTGTWEGNPYVDKGTILQIEKEKILKYNYWSSFSGTEDIPSNYANIVYQLEEQPNHVLLTITQDGIKSEEAREHSEKNWKMILNTIKELLEK